VPGAVDVRVVAVGRLVLDVRVLIVMPRSRSSGALSIDAKSRTAGAAVALGEHLGDGSRERRLASGRCDQIGGRRSDAAWSLELLLGHSVPILPSILDPNFVDA
jgi:hypothetical protein